MALDLGSMLFLAAAAGLLALYLGARNIPNYWALSGALPGVQVPELKLGYDADDLDRFVSAARAAKLRSGVSALELYVEPTLRRDGYFAISLAAALVFLNVGVIPWMPLRPYGVDLAVFCAVMAAVYGLSDCLENAALRRIFRRAPPVEPKRAAWASRWTWLKFITLFLACPAVLGLLAKLGNDYAFDPFYGVLKFWPVAVLIVACFRPALARVLWACRVSVVSALAGYYLFFLVVQAQDLFADTSYGDWSRSIGFWVGAYLAAIFIWALPVHYAARAALEGEEASPYVEAVGSARLIRWTPRVLGMIPLVAVLLGIFGAALDTRYAWDLDAALPRQFVLLSLGGWAALGLVLIFMLKRRSFVARVLGGPYGRPSRIVVWLCAGATFVVFIALVSAPLIVTRHIDRAALAPIVLGSGVLLFGWLGRLSDRTRRPIFGLAIAVVVGLTARNAGFNEVRSVTVIGAPNRPGEETIPQRTSLDAAARSWRKENCAADNDPKTCPPALIVAADGGASRAGYFSAAVVGNLLDRLATGKAGESSSPGCVDPNNPARCLFAFSGVSGGSLGLAIVKAALLDAKSRLAHDRKTDPAAKLRPPCAGPLPAGREWRDCLSQLVVGDYLSPAFVGLAFRDQFAPPFPPFTDREIWGDRAVLLEKAAERAYRAKTTGDESASECLATTPDDGLCRPFAAPAIGPGWTPRLLLNGTSVQTGRRVIASEIEPTYKDLDGHPRALHAWAYDFFDILGAQCQAGCTADHCRPVPGAPESVRLSTAAFLSARFPIISPAAHVHMASCPERGDAIVDGGYFENSGLTTALDVAHGLKTLGLTPIVLSISNDPAVEKVEQVKAAANTAAANKAAPDAECAPPPAPLEIERAKSNSVLIRAIEIVYAPLNAFYRARDGHGDEAAYALRQRLQEWNATSVCDPTASFFPIRVYKDGSGFPMPEVSMSWWLSPIVRNGLDNQLKYKENLKQFCRLEARLGVNSPCEDQTSGQ